MRVLGWQTRGRNESNAVGVKRTIDRSLLVGDLSESISVGTRKMVNYACIG